MLNFELQLDERLPDRVIVSVLLGPGDTGEASVDGVAVVLVAATGELLSTRLMLPIAGTLLQPVLTTVELRALGPVPLGARIVGTAWDGAEQHETSIPADPGTQLEAHCRGLRNVKVEEDRALRFRRPTRADLAALQQAFVWLQPPPESPLQVVENEPEPEEDDDDDFDLREACSELGLDDEEAAWLEDLLNEPDDD